MEGNDKEIPSFGGVAEGRGGSKSALCELGNNPVMTDADDIQGRDEKWWGRFAQTSAKEGLAESVYYHQTRSAFAGRCPANVFRSLESEYVSTLARNTLFLKQADDLKTILEGHAYLLLKGAFLADCVYPSPGLRRFSDIDVLVRKNDLKAVEERLVSRGGYHGVSGMASSDTSYLNSVMYGRESGGPAVHVHWHIQNSILPKYVGAGFDIEEIWESAQPSSNAPLEMRPEHLVLHLADHALRHSFHRLILIRDVIEVIRWAGPRWNWFGLRDEAIRLGLVRPLYYTLLLIAARGGMTMDREILEALKPPGQGFLERWYEKELVADHRRPEASSIVYGSSLPSWKERLRFVYRMLFPPRDVLARAYGRKPQDIGVGDYVARLFRGFRYLLPKR